MLPMAAAWCCIEASRPASIMTRASAFASL
jgi:hypothetical protein